MGVLDFLGGLASAGADVWNNERNIQFQQQTNDTNWQHQLEAWGREDNAVQRRSADLQAAGLNPVLAAGGAASSMGPIQMKAPQATENPVRGGLVAASAIKDMEAKQASINQTQAQTDLIRASTVGKELENQFSSGTLEARQTMIKNEAEKSTQTLAAAIQMEQVKLDAAQINVQTAELQNKFQIDKNAWEYGGWIITNERKEGGQTIATYGWIPGVASLRQQLLAQGVAQGELDIAASKIQNDILQKTDNWFTAGKVIGAIDSVAGAVAAGAGARSKVMQGNSYKWSLPQ